MYKILIVEDDKALCNNIKEGISKWNFEGIAVQNFEDILKEFAKHNPHLVIMDITCHILTDFTGAKRLGIYPTFRLYSFLKDSNMDIVMAVNMGGDDYVTKPFSMDVLLAKMQALIRRAYSYGQFDGR